MNRKDRIRYHVSNQSDAKTKPHLVLEMGSWYSFHGNLSVTGYFLAFFADLCNFLRHFLSSRTIAQTFGLWSSLQLRWLYKGHSGYCFDISIFWDCFRTFWVGLITLLDYNKTKCNWKPLLELFTGVMLFDNSV